MTANTRHTDNSKVKLRFVVFHGTERWIAQCLEVNLQAQVDELSQLSSELRALLEGHVALSIEAGMDPSTAMSKVQDKYLAMWERAKPMKLRVSTFGEFEVSARVLA